MKLAKYIQAMPDTLYNQVAEIYRTSYFWELSMNVVTGPAAPRQKLVA